MKTIKLKRLADMPAVAVPPVEAPAAAEKAVTATVETPGRQRSAETIFVALAIAAVLSLLLVIGLTVAETAFYRQAPSVWP